MITEKAIDAVIDRFKGTGCYGEMIQLGGVRYIKTAEDRTVRDPFYPAEPQEKFLTNDEKKEQKERNDACIENCRKNTKWILRHNGETRYQLDHRGVPCYIVGAGPSLEKNYRELDKITHGVVIALNLALPYCPNATYFNTCDYEGRDSWYEDKQGNQLAFPNTTALISIRASTRIPKDRFKRVLWYGDTTPFSFMKRAKAEFPFMPRLDPGWHITFDAVQIAVRMMCNPIIFVGQDYALTNNQEHAFHSEQRHGELQEMPDIYGNTTLSSKIFLNAFASIAAQLFFVSQRRDVFNATEGGILHDSIFETFLRKNDKRIALHDAIKTPAIHQQKLSKIVEVLNKAGEKGAA